MSLFRDFATTIPCNYNASIMQLPHTTLRFSDRKPLVMGILNITPDSFSDGGKFFSAESAIARAEEMIAQGADIIDVGPESSRPGSLPVPADEQLRRVDKVISKIRKDNPEITISIDTRLAAVAQGAIDAGADIINDISGLTDDPELIHLAARTGTGLVIMHMQNRPANMQEKPIYENVTHEILDFLLQQAHAAEAAGVLRERIIIDPGIGFGKTTQHNLTIMRELRKYTETGYPVLLGASRKRFLGDISPPATETSQRLPGSLACVAQALNASVQIVRVHDVLETVQFINAFSSFCG